MPQSGAPYTSVVTSPSVSLTRPWKPARPCSAGRSGALLTGEMSSNTAAWIIVSGRPGSVADISTVTMSLSDIGHREVRAVDLVAVGEHGDEVAAVGQDRSRVAKSLWSPWVTTGLELATPIEVHLQELALSGNVENP